MSKFLKQIRSLKKINKSTVTNKNFLIKREDNIEIYYAPFDYINSKAKIMIVGITPGLQQMLQSFEAVNEGRSLKEVKDLSSFKGSMRTTLIKYLDALNINKKLRIKSCESLFNINSKYLHSTSLIKYPVFDKGRNYSGSGLLKKKILLDFLEAHFVKELKKLDKTIIIPLGNTVSSTIDYLNNEFKLNLKCFLKGFPHPSGLNVRKDIQFKENKIRMLNLLKS
jgi:hypothetical protein